MAIYHYNEKNISRKKGQTSLANLAYITGRTLVDERTGIRCYPGHKLKERVQAWETAIPNFANPRFKDSSALFNGAEKAETDADARTAKKVEFALPREFSKQQQIAAVKEFCEENFYGHGYVWAIHNDPKGNNPHAHILVTNRPFDRATGEFAKVKEQKVYVIDKEHGDPENGYKVPVLDKNGKQKINKGRRQWKRKRVLENGMDDSNSLKRRRKSWAKVANLYLDRQHKIDYRSYKDQGVNRIPTIHEGWYARQILCSGKESERCGENCQIQSINRDIAEKERLQKEQETIHRQIAALRLQIQQEKEQKKQRQQQEKQEPGTETDSEAEQEKNINPITYGDLIDFATFKMLEAQRKALMLKEQGKKNKAAFYEKHYMQIGNAIGFVIRSTTNKRGEVVINRTIHTSGDSKSVTEKHQVFGQHPLDSMQNLTIPEGMGYPAGHYYMFLDDGRKITEEDLAKLKDGPITVKAIRDGDDINNGKAPTYYVTLGLDDQGAPVFLAMDTSVKDKLKYSEYTPLYKPRIESYKRRTPSQTKLMKNHIYTYDPRNFRLVHDNFKAYKLGNKAAKLENVLHDFMENSNGTLMENQAARERYAEEYKRTSMNEAELADFKLRQAVER